MQRREPAYELQDGEGDHGLPLLRCVLATLRVALDDGLEVVYVVEVDALQGLDHGVYVPWHRDVYEEQRLAQQRKRPCDRLALNDPLAGACGANDDVHLR